MFLVTVLIGATAPAFADLGAPREEWSIEIPRSHRFDASPVAHPPDRPDGLVVGVGGRVWKISGKGEIVFDTSFGPETGRGRMFDAGVADLDGDGSFEILGGHNDGAIAAIDGATGKVIWEFDNGNEIGRWRLPSAVDLDGDGMLEVVATDRTGWASCVDHRGRLRWRTKVERFRGSSPSIGDIDRDGRPEIVYGTASRHVIALDAMGRVLWDSFHPRLHLGRSTPLIADLDGDDDAEIYLIASNIGPDTGLLSLNGADGAVRWTGRTRHKAYKGLGLIRFEDGTEGVLACDKANSVGAFEPDGTLRWRADLSGRGIWTPGAVADLDGDGSHEIVIAVRDTSRDGKSASWYVLDLKGRVEARHELEGGGYGGPLVADIDDDGVIEVVLASRSGRLTCFSFEGGGDGKGAGVFWSSWAGRPYPARRGEARRPYGGPDMTWIESLPPGRFGHNPLRLSLDDIAHRVPKNAERLAVEVDTAAPDGTRQVRVYKFEDGARSVDVTWPVFAAGTHEVTLRLLDFEAPQIVAALQTLETTVPDVLAEVRGPMQVVSDQIARDRKQLGPRSPATIVLAHHALSLEGRFGMLRASITGAGRSPHAARRRLARDVDDFLDFVERTRRLGLLVAEAGRTGGAPFTIWRDANPWDNVDPRNDLPLPRRQDDRPAPEVLWAFGNETESICFNVVNLGASSLTLRFEKGRLERPGVSPQHAIELTTLHRVVRLPSRFDETVGDLLPRLGDGYLLQIAPGEVEQVWINVSTVDVKPGRYTLSWPVRTLDAASVTVPLTFQLDVSIASVPAESRYSANFWSSNRIGQVDTVDDLNRHGQNVWTRLPLPGAQADARGNLVGELDWTAHDAIVGRARVRRLLYGSPPTPKFPDGVEVTTDLKRTARRNYLKALVAHLATMGLSHEHFMFYPEDEPGLVGDIDGYMRNARENKLLDPEVQNFANPWGAVTLEMIEQMAPVTDVWQPGMDTIHVLGEPYVQLMRRGRKPISTYSVVGSVRIMKPLGFYRGQPWVAFFWGIEGGGWWTYHGADLWATRPDREPEFGTVACDGRALVTTRRWEATRDGIEDFNLLSLLRERAEDKDDEDALAVLDAAVSYVGNRSYHGMPREAGEYELDFKLFMEHRVKLRAALERLVAE